MTAAPGANLPLRLASAAAGLPLLALVVWAGGPWMAGVAGVAALAGANELLSLQRRAGWRPLVAQGTAWAGIMTGAAAIDGRAVLVALVTGAVALAVVAAVSRRSMEALGDWTFTTAGTVYVSLALAAVVLTRRADAGLEWAALAFLAVFAADTGAYAVGRLIGRRRLAPSVSPGKTWEGAGAGLLAAAGATVGLVYLFDGIDDRLWLAIALGAGIGVVSQIGDLLESKLKRLGGIKDSGRLIPGHGGILDRLDSLLPVFPLVYFASRWWPGA